MVETFVQSTDDVVKFLKDQHNLIKDMFDEVFSASSDDARRKAFTELRQLLAVHETAEEMVVHPRVRHEVEGGDIIVDARLVEEHDSKEHLAALEAMDIGSQEFLDELKLFQGSVIDHAEREEVEEFSRLQRELDGDDLEPDGEGRDGGRGHCADPSARRRGIRQGEFRARTVRIDARPCA